MEVREAIRKRRSIRAFLPRPVPHQVIEDVLDVARWSPSATNAQEWYIVVVSGERLRNLSDALVKAAESDPLGHDEIGVPQYLPVMTERSRTLGWKIYATKGITREDKAKRAWWAEQGLRFFDAPSVVFIHTHKSMCPFLLRDMGVLAQSIMLMAEDEGLGTCPMIRPCSYPEIVKPLLNIPDDHAVVLALALGYPDSDDPVNSFPRDREPLSSLVSWIE